MFEDIDWTKLLVSFIVGGIGIGVALWLSVKIVDRENRNNTLMTAIVFGLLIQGLLFLPTFWGKIVGLAISLMLLNFFYQTNELEFGESFVSFIIAIVLLIPIGFLTYWLMRVFF